jgi:hypothetical protein
VKKIKTERPAIKASSEAKRSAQAVLEVLAGIRGPSDAAEALSTSLPNYYKLETRALEGLVKALEPREAGRRRVSEEARLHALEKERDGLRRELDRTRSLVRLAQRCVGMPQAPQPSDKKDGKGRKPRRSNRVKRILSRLGKGENAETPAAATAPSDSGAGAAEESAS